MALIASHLRRWTPEGCGEASTATQRTLDPVFGRVIVRMPVANSVRGFGEILRGVLVDQSSRQRALCVSQQELPAQSQHNGGFPCGVASFHVLHSLLLVSRFPAERRAEAPASVVLQQCRSMRTRASSRRGEGRRTATDRSGPRACRKGRTIPGHRPRRAHTKTRATIRPARPSSPTPPVAS